MTQAPKIGGVAFAVLLAFFLAPAPAAGHIHSGTVAVDHRASADRLSPPLAGALTVRVEASDLALRLAARPGHRVVVLGYEGEPFLRIDERGVATNAASSTAAAAGLLEGLGTTRVGPAWRVHSHEPVAVWHDRRLRGAPFGYEHRAWSVPVIVDGERALLEGEVWRVAGPALWLWLALAAVPALITVLLLVARRPRLIRPAAVGVALFAGAVALVSAAGFALDANASGVSWLEAGNELVLVGAGVGVLAIGSPEAKAIASGALGVPGVFAGLLKAPVLIHGVVLSALPATLTRAAVVLAISAGCAAVILGALAFEQILARGDHSRVELSR